MLAISKYLLVSMRCIKPTCAEHFFIEKKCAEHFPAVACNIISRDSLSRVCMEPSGEEH
jgi:hypothetical protein